jgi:hypothetical protein
MRRFHVALVAATALLTMTFAWTTPANAASATPKLGPEGIVLTCTGWSIPEITFDTDTDGNGHQTATLEITSVPAEAGPPAVSFRQTYTFPVGTTTSLSGTYSAPVQLNPIAAQLNDSQAQDFLGACDQNRWMAPNVSWTAVYAGEPFYVTFGGCQLTHSNLTVTDADGATLLAIRDELIPWPYTGPNRPIYASFPVTLPPGFQTRPGAGPPDQIWHATGFCGTAADPSSDPTNVDIPLYALAPPGGGSEPGSTGPAASPAQAVGASPNLTG